MKRTDLLRILKGAQPALGSGSIMPALECFWFGDGRVVAFDDVVAIDAPCELDLDGGVKGAPLLKFLSASKARTLDMSLKEGTFLVKAGRATLKANVWAGDSFPFEFPDFEEATKIEADDALIEGLRRCCVSLGEDDRFPSRMGVTLFLDENGTAWMYSTNNTSMSRANCPVETDEQLETALSPRFVTLLVSMANREVEALYVHEDWTAAVFEDGFRLFSKAVAEPDSGQYETIIEDIADQDTVEIPKQLAGALDRALSVTPVVEKGHTLFKIKDGVLKLRTNGKDGVVNDRMSVSEDHPDEESGVDVSLVRQALKHVTHFRIVEGRAVLFRGDGFDHFVAVLREEESEE